MNIELIVQNGSKIYVPLVKDDIIWTTDRKGTPGQLKFSVLKDKDLNITEGNAVRLKVDGKGVFYGFIFTKKRDKEGIIDIVAYDQLRYFKNKDTYVYTNKTASEFLKMLISDFRLNAGNIEDTKYKISSRVEENSTLFDMVQNALDLTLQNKKEVYVLYDDFGKLALKNIGSMKVPILIDEETASNFKYSSSIDNNTYNKIKLSFNNEKTGKREIFIAQNSQNMNAWGILQYYEVLQKAENGKAKADALLELYNKRTRNLSINDAFGDIRVRAGSMIIVKLNLGDINTQNYMLVEKCKHTFTRDTHMMDLTLKGGDFVV